MRRRFLRFAVCQDLVASCNCVLLRNQKPAYLQELIRLLAGKLISKADCLHLPARALRARLQPLQLACIGFHRILLLVKAPEKAVGGFLLGFGAKAL